MTKRRFLSLIILILISFSFFSTGNAAPINNPQNEDISIRDYFNSVGYGNYQSAKESGDLFLAQTDDEVYQDIYGFKSKSTSKGFLLSLLLPGAGEFYAESKIKAGVFLGLEVLLWAGYLSYHNKAENKESEYIDFANTNWSREAYTDSMLTIYGVDIDTIQTGTKLVSDYDSVVIVEHLPDTKTQQYYEMIGKYDQFRYGWDDFDRTNFLTPHRNHYLDMRDDSNKLFDNARYSLIAIIGNHILSGFDAVWSVKKYNKKAGGFSELNMKIRLVEEYDQKPSPRILFTYKF
jgi:hypothetical protein